MNGWTPKQWDIHFISSFIGANQRMSQRPLFVKEMTEGVVSNETDYVTVEQLGKTHYLSFLVVNELPTSMFGSSFIQTL
ncbi:hypothetical protein D929_01689 [Enterococcus faecalis 02-MB-P-10]|uniref:hypothetical protein n=1 Tax=Enterococcus faecalis TaxID=1351 RepID=UPI000352F412|nr:hypothetical protein [Enterococcus faecalis]EPH73209.1 hypothetical protein D929_01689 [Enterococcus faecalis 02-MB-P-10]